MDLEEFKKKLNLIYGKYYENNFSEKKILMLYNITETINNFKNPDELIFIYNKIFIQLTEHLNSEYNFTKKDNILIKNVFNYLNIIKNILIISSEDEKNFDDYIYIEILYFKYKKIDDTKYNEIKNYKLSLLNKDPVVLYKELWEIFLNPQKDSIINRNIEYYISDLYNIENVKIINKKIIYEYINIILNNIKYEKYNLKKYSNGIIFLMLINDII